MLNVEKYGINRIANGQNITYIAHFISHTRYLDSTDTIFFHSLTCTFTENKYRHLLEKLLPQPRLKQLQSTIADLITITMYIINYSLCK